MAQRKSTVVKKISLQARRVTRLHESNSEDRPSYAPYILDIGKADNDAFFMMIQEYDLSTPKISGGIRKSFRLISSHFSINLEISVVLRPWLYQATL